MRDTAVRFAEHEGNYVAYSVFGEGRNDLVAKHWRFPIDLIWEFPQLGAFMESLGRMARVIVLDDRGSGASDSAEVGFAFGEDRADDLLAVLDSAGVDKVTLFEMDSSGFGVTFAATYPERVRSLIAVNLRRSFPELRNLSPTDRSRLALRMRSSVDSLHIEDPRVAHDPDLQRWWLKATRLAMPRDRLVRLLEHSAHVDYSAVLPLVQAPTLVLHRRDNRVWDVESSRAAASLIPNARFVEVPGAENDIFLGDTDPVLAEIERFLHEPDVEVDHDRPLATVLFTDIVDSTEQLATRGDDAWRRLLDSHDQTMDRVVKRYRGRVVKQLGDGILATFDGPARAVRCAAAILTAANEHGITLRAGLHTGEIEIRPSDVAGIAVHIASRIAALAAANEILVSRTVVDLTAGSGLTFEPRGDRQLKGIPGNWPTFAAHTNT